MAHSTRRRALAGSALFGLLAAAPAIPPLGTDPDAALIALCREYVDHSNRHQSVCAKQDAMPDHHSAAEHAEWMRLDDLAQGHGLRMLELEDEIPELPAITPAGQRAKAAALLELMRHISPKYGSTFTLSLANDLVGRG